MEWLFIFGLAFALWMSRRRVSRLEELIAELTTRVYDLESRPAAAPPPVVLPTPVTVAPPPLAPQVVEEEPVAVQTTPVVQSPEAERPFVQPPEPDRPFVPPPPEPVFVPDPGPTLSDRLRQMVGDDEWESLVGGSLLNKLGAFVLVIGLVLFLGYSFTQMGPAGRVAVSLTVSVALLGSGIVVERMQGYRVFAWGLLGAGWACLYSTTYAMFAMDAARVIENGTLGALLLVTVAAAMIGHSLRYRSQTVTAITAASAYGALALSPSKQFGVGALIPLRPRCSIWPTG
ncbi:MAG: DUF2339 domain-containing protein [Paludibaculum sp.]